MSIRPIPWSSWQHHQALGSLKFVCGFCETTVGGHAGYVNGSDNGSRIYLCPHCGFPTLFQDSSQYPGPSLGRAVRNLPPDVVEIYRELRNTVRDANYTAALLLGRKLIMHLAVDIAGAKEGESFHDYVEHLKRSGYIPPNGDRILEYIRTLGNEKNHEIRIGKKEEGDKILKFIEGLLIFIYEFPADLNGSGSKVTPS